MGVIFLCSVFSFAYLTLYICSPSLLFHSYFQIRSRGYVLFQFSILWYITFCILPLISNDLIFYFSRIFPILTFLLSDPICLLTCAKKPRFEPFFGFSRGFLEFFCYLIGSFDGRPAFLGNFFPVGWIFRMTTKDLSMSVSASWNFSVFSRLPPRILMAVWASVSSSWILPDLYGMK